MSHRLGSNQYATNSASSLSSYQNSGSRTLQQYDSLSLNYSTTTGEVDSTLETASSDDEMSLLTTNLQPAYWQRAGQGVENDGEQVLRPSTSRTKVSHRMATRVAIVVGLGIVVVLWMGTMSYEWRNYEQDDIGLIVENDDDQVPDTFMGRVSARLLPSDLNVPLLGHSRYDPDHEAKQSRKFLNLNDKDVIYSDGKHHKKQEELLGSSGYDSPSIKAPEGCEGTVMILRHCEKGSIREHCNYVGYERSVYLASLFGEGPNHRWPEPAYVFAETPGMRRNPHKKNFRELETVLPLAEKFNLTVDTSYSTLDTRQFTRHIQSLFRSGEMCGKLMVIAWKHSKLPRLAHALGCGPREGCPTHYRGTDFDSLWQIKYVYQMPLHSSRRSLEPPTRVEWQVYGSVQPQGFDPLSFSKEVKDYPPGGTHKSARWMEWAHEIPEREIIGSSKNKKKHHV